MGFFKFDGRTWVVVPSVQGLIVASTSILKWLRSTPLFIQYPEGGGGTWLRLKKKGNCVTRLCISAHFRRGQQEPLWHHLATENQGSVSELRLNVRLLASTSWLSPAFQCTCSWSSQLTYVSRHSSVLWGLSELYSSSTTLTSLSLLFDDIWFIYSI